MYWYLLAAGEWHSAEDWAVQASVSGAQEEGRLQPSMLLVAYPSLSCVAAEMCSVLAIFRFLAANNPYFAQFHTQVTFPSFLVT